MVGMIRSRLSAQHLRLMELLVEARTEAGLMQGKLAERLRRPQSYVSKYESGERRLDVVEFLQVVRAIGCDPHPIVSQVMDVPEA